MTPDRARLEAIKKRLRWFQYGSHATDVSRLVEWFEEALELLHVESSLAPVGKKNTRVVAFLSRFEEQHEPGE